MNTSYAVRRMVDGFCSWYTIGHRKIDKDGNRYFSLDITYKGDL